MTHFHSFKLTPLTLKESISLLSDIILYFLYESFTKERKLYKVARSSSTPFHKHQNKKVS